MMKRFLNVALACGLLVTSTISVGYAQQRNTKTTEAQRRPDAGERKTLTMHHYLVGIVENEPAPELEVVVVYHIVSDSGKRVPNSNGVNYGNGLSAEAEATAEAAYPGVDFQFLGNSTSPDPGKKNRAGKAGSFTSNITFVGIQKIVEETPTEGPALTMSLRTTFDEQAVGIWEVAITVTGVTPDQITNDTWTQVAAFAISEAADLDGPGGLEAFDFAVNQGFQPTTSPTPSNEPAGTVYILQIRNVHIVPELVTAYVTATIPWISGGPARSDFHWVVTTQLGTTMEEIMTGFENELLSSQDGGDNVAHLLDDSLDLHENYYKVDAHISDFFIEQVNDGTFNVIVTVLTP